MPFPKPSADFSDRERSIFPLLLLLGSVALMLSQVIHFPFVLHDDSLEILSNRNFYPLDGAALRRIWSAPDFSRIFIPVNYSVLGGLTAFSRWLHHLDGLAQPRPDVFHVSGVLLHLLNTFLVFRLVRPAVGEKKAAFPWISLLASFLFALHPVQVESYARAGNVTITFGAACSLLSLDCFVRCWQCPQHWGRWYAAATLLFSIGILSRPTVAALPVVAFAIVWANRGTQVKALARSLCPWLLISVAYIWISLRFQPPFPAQGSAGVFWLWRPVIAADSMLWYLAQILWPTTLSVDHGRTPDQVLANRFIWLSAAGLLALLVLLFYCARKGNRWVTCGGLIFLTLLLPVAGLVPTANRETMSIVYDRHLYLPLLGVAMVFAAFLSSLRPDFRLAVGLLIVCMLGAQTRSYQRVWGNSITLFQHVVTANPQSWYGNGQLGTALLFSGRPAEAAPALARALELNPRLTDARVNLGQALLDLGRDSEAEQVLREATQRAPSDPNAHNNLAVALLRRQESTEAETEVRQALRLNPTHLLATTNLCLALAGQNRIGEATALARGLVSARPDFAVGWRTLSEILLKSGQKDDGIRALARACQLDPRRPDWQQLLNSLQTDSGTGAKR